MHARMHESPRVQVLDLSANQLGGKVPPGICSMRLLSPEKYDWLFTSPPLCNLTQLPGVGNAAALSNWDCSLIPCTCSDLLAEHCGIDGSCALSCYHRTLVIVTAVVLSVLVIVVPIVVVVCVRKRSRRDFLAKRRDATLRLLQGFVDGNNDLAEAMLPADSIDFGPSACVRACVRGGVSRCLQ